MGKLPSLHWDVAPARRRSLAFELERWQALHAQVSGCVLISAETLGAALTHFGTGDERFAFARQDGKDCIAMLVNAPARTSVGLFLPSQLPLAPILNATYQPLQMRDLRAALAALSPTGLVLRVGSLDPRWGTDIAVREKGEKFVQTETPAIDLPSELEPYMQARANKFRSDLRRRRKKAQTELGEVRFEAITDKNLIEDAVKDYGALEARGWKGAAGTAVATEGAQFRFYADWLCALALENKARIFVLRIGQKVAAMRLAIEDSGCLYMLKVSYEETLRAYSPGALMLENVIEWCYEPGVNVRRIEFYGKVSEAHQPWLTETRAMSIASVYRFEWLAKLRIAAKHKETTLTTAPIQRSAG